VWNFHCGLNEFGHLNRTVDAIKNRYGKPVDVNDFARKCQVLNYELMRPMFESFLVNHPVSTGVIQWMLNSAFPEMYWQLYDSYLMPNAAYFATRKACAPLHLLYHYGSSSIHLINELPKDATGLKYSIKRYNLNSDVIAVDKGFIDIEKQTQIKILDAPWMDLNNPMEFLLLQLFDQADQLIDDNFYWLSAKEDIMDYEAIAGSWSFYTPTKQYADLTGINDLPKANLLVKTQTEIPGTHNVTILNTSPHLAFFIELKIYSKDNQLVLPILWSDNYISLPPFEQRVVTLDVPNEYLNEHLMVTARGYNTAKHAKILNT
ncbi:MAG: hypothetical protein KDC53_09925, partial [Saprospiraceae bacterium]|nr:hypothetical protein [Saprospiraceae bacterium]